MAVISFPRFVQPTLGTLRVSFVNSYPRSVFSSYFSHANAGGFSEIIYLSICECESYPSWEPHVFVRKVVAWARLQRQSGDRTYLLGHRFRCPVRRFLAIPITTTAIVLKV